MDRREGPIFDEIRESRSTRSRVWSLVGGTAVECAVLGSALVVYEITAFQDASSRALASLRAEFANYRVVLIAPTSIPGRPAAPEPEPAPRPRRRAPPAPPPDPIERLEERMASFVRSNPGLEKIVTRELMPDADSRVLDLGKLLQKTLIRVRFRIDDDGRMAEAILDTSSGTASIDHLALELVRVLEKYRVLAPMKGLENVLATIRIEEDVEVRLEAEAVEPAAAEEMRKQLESLLGLLRLALAKSEAAMLLQDVEIVASERQIVLQKSFEKSLLVTFLTQLTGDKAQQPQPKP